MEITFTDNIPTPEDWENTKSIIKVIGVGGGGCNVVTGMFNEKFLNFMQIPLKAGKYHTAPNEILVNPAFVKGMKWTSDGIGETVPGLGTVTGIIDISFPDQSQSSPYYVSWVSDEIKGWPIDLHARLKEPFEDNLIRLNQEMTKMYFVKCT